jgi:hypothetical protein
MMYRLGSTTLDPNFIESIWIKPIWIKPSRFWHDDDNAHLSLRHSSRVLGDEAVCVCQGRTARLHHEGMVED